MAAPPRELILNAFVMQTPSHLNPGVFRSPEDKGRQYKNIDHWIELAQKLEKAKFHAIFFADVLGGYDVYKGPANIQPALAAAAQIPLIDPLYTVPALAAATESIGFGVTASTTYENPYALARRFSTVDHLTKGRVAWNIVTSYLESAARNFGLDTQIEHDERYRIAEEYLNVTYKLWEGSWRDDAVVNDANGYVDPTAVRPINHKGKYFKVPGPHICEPSPQRTPLLFQAGTSPAGTKFASRHAEAVFVAGMTPELVRATVDLIRKQAAEAGRDPRDVKIIQGMLVIVAETDEAAWAKYEHLRTYGDREGALALFGGWTGIDASKFSDEDDFRVSEHTAVRNLANRWAATVPGGGSQKWTKDNVVDYLKVGGSGVRIIGSAKTVADGMEDWVRKTDIDGFNLGYATIPGTFDDIIEFLLPELQKRGLFWKDYAVKGGTLRENYTGKPGQTRLPSTHVGAKYTWKAGQADPPFSSKEGTEPAAESS